jgi:hypothetical protein
LSSTAQLGCLIFMGPRLRSPCYCERFFSKITRAGFINLKRAVAGLKTAHLPKITLSFEFPVLTLTVPGLRLRKVQNTSCF